MSKVTLKGVFTFLFIFTVLLTNAQRLISNNSSEKLWIKTSESRIAKLNKVNRSSRPIDFQLYELNLEKLKEKLSNAPMRGDVIASKSSVKIAFPNATGEFETFSIIETPVMESELAKKMPMIKAYAGQGIEDPSATMRFTVTQFGLHTMTLSGSKRSWYIDPYTKDKNNYIIYSKDALGIDNQGFECLTGEKVDLPSLRGETSTLRATNDNKLRTYRLAQSCTGEYGTIFKGSGSTAAQKANVQAQMAITMTRVNGIYERDLATTMIFIANNDDIIYLTANTDPWTNEWNTKTAETIDNVIGINNYDIGHNFNTTGGGNAGCLGCVCLGSETSNSQSDIHKGRGYTGRSNPTGDAFDVDYVAHEMGHQFDGFHTMNTCSRSGSGATEVEPASGSTIMGYAGICSSNIQNNSDAYFNYVNIRDISANIKTGNSSSCDVESTIGNSAPTADAGNNYTIPVSTPYMLIGNSTDVDGTASHTFTWEQNDPEQAPNGQAPPAANSATGPMVRSIEGTTNPIRYIPNLTDLLNTGGSTTWEVLPSVSRQMEFALTVRDNNAGGGQTADDLMTVTTSTSAGPFSVSSQNTNSVWQQGSTQTISWNVASTNSAPVSAEFVDIFLSKDGGLTYPTILATATPNDGSHDIIVPNGESTNCRIMVKGSDNIFFNINTAVINISGSIAPTISYISAIGNIIEGSNCDYTDITVPLSIGQGPSQNAVATFSMSAGDATSGLDYDIMTPTVTFDQGLTNSQNLILRIYNDSFIEVDETITIDFTVNANSGNAVSGTNSYTFTINNDDFDPLISGAPSLLFSDDFESGFGQWNITTATGTNDFAIANNGTFPDAGYFNSDGSNSTNYAYVNDDSAGNNYNMSQERIAMATAITLPIGKIHEFNFDYVLGTNYGGSASVEVSYDNGITWLSFGTLVGVDQDNSIPFSTFQNTITNNGTLPLNYIFSIVYRDAGQWAQGLIIDNVAINSEIEPLAVQTTVNTSTINAINLKVTGSANTYDATSGDLMVNYNNTNGFDYGCIDTNVVRAGNGAQAYNGSITPAFVTDKFFTITPTNTTTNTATELTFYFTEAEILGWETATLLSRNNLFAKREGSHDIVPVTVSAYGPDIALTGVFTGLSGNYYFGPEDAFKTAVAPKVYLQGAFLNSPDGLMRDDVRTMLSTTSPYDATICNASVFTVTGNNAIVDWIQVELRDANSNTTIVDSQSALLQRDGDVVSIDGISPLIFIQPSANYYIVIKHRNHLGIMTTNPISLKASNVITVDFTDATNPITYGSNAQTVFGIPVNSVAMWSGNVNEDAVIQYSGASSDIPSILSEIINDSGNFLNLPTYTVDGYNINDVNMDGKTQYNGVESDTPFIVQNILSHPENFLNFSTFQIEEQLPEN